jgi:hypothetical protein
MKNCRWIIKILYKSKSISTALFHLHKTMENKIPSTVTEITSGVT